MDFGSHIYKYRKSANDKESYISPSAMIVQDEGNIYTILMSDSSVSVECDIQLFELEKMAIEHLNQYCILYKAWRELAVTILLSKYLTFPKYIGHFIVGVNYVGGRSGRSGRSARGGRGGNGAHDYTRMMNLQGVYDMTKMSDKALAIVTARGIAHEQMHFTDHDKFSLIYSLITAYNHGVCILEFSLNYKLERSPGAGFVYDKYVFNDELHYIICPEKYEIGRAFNADHTTPAQMEMVYNPLHLYESLMMLAKHMEDKTMMRILKTYKGKKSGGNADAIDLSLFDEMFESYKTKSTNLSDYSLLVRRLA